MAADTTYRVLARYEVDTKDAESGVDRLSGMLDRLKSAFQFALAGFGFEKLIETTVRLNSEIENTKIQLAGFMNAANAPGTQDFNAALRMSSFLLDDIRAKAAKVPGTWQDVAKIVSTLTMPGEAAGAAMMGQGSIESVALKAQGIFGAMFSSDRIAHSLEMAMTGHARSDVIFTKLKNAMPDMGEGFKKMSNVERWEAINKALDHFQGMIDAQSHSWTSVFTTAKNYFQILEANATHAFFDVLKGTLNDLNNWFAANKTQVEEFVKTFSEGLARAAASAFTAIKDAVSFIIAHKQGLLQIAEMFLLVKGFSMLGGGFNWVAGTPTAAPSLGGVAFGAGAGIALAQLTGATDPVSRSMMALEGAMATLPGTVGLVGKALLVFHGALQATADLILKGHARELTQKEEREHLLNLAKEFRTGGMNDALYARTRALMNTEHMVSGYGLNRRLEASYIDNKGLSESGMLSASKLLNSAFERMKNEPLFFGPESPTTAQKEIQRLFDANKAKSVVAHKGNTNITVRIEQTIEDATDPEKILIKTREALDQALIHPIESGHHPLATLVGGR